MMLHENALCASADLTIGTLLDQFAPQECAGYITNAGYASI